MKAVRATIGQMVILLVLGTALGLGANAARTKDHIYMGRNYKPKVAAPVGPAAPEATTPVAESPSTPVEPTKVADDDERDKPAEATKPVEPAKPKEPARAPTLMDLPAPTAEHPFREVTLAEARTLFDDAKYTAGAYIFVDARNEQHYKAGHIVGAYLCDYYRVEQYADAVLPLATQAEKVIVYCNGGQCEDSINLCMEFDANSVPWNKIYLFRGGWEEWTQAGLPTEKE